MGISVNVRVSGVLAEYVQSRITENGLYENASEYLRELIRKDLRENSNKKFNEVEAFNNNLIELANTDRKDFIDMDVDNIIKKAKQKALDEKC